MIEHKRKRKVAKRPAAAKVPRTSQLTPTGGSVQRTRKVMLPPPPRLSAVTLTLSEGTKISYAEMLATARQKVPLPEFCIEQVKIKKAMIGRLILEVPGDREREMALALAARLTKALDPTTMKVVVPTRTANLRVTKIDISVGKEELRDTLTRAGGCKALEVRVGDIKISRGGLTPI